MLKKIEQSRKSLSTSDLVEYLNEKSKTISIAEINKSYKSRLMFRPSIVDPRQELELVQYFFQSLPAQSIPIMLSPVAPFGATAVLSSTSQINILSAVRKTEVNNNIAVSLSLEAGYRLKEAIKKRKNAIRLASWARIARTQKMVGQQFTPHFGIAGQCTAQRGRWIADRRADLLAEQIGVFLKLVNYYLSKYNITAAVECWFTDLAMTEHLLEQGKVDRQKITRTAKNYTQNWLEDNIKDIPNVCLPSELPSQEVMQHYGIATKVEGLAKLATAVEYQLKKLSPSFKTRLEFCRLRGIGLYEGECFSLVIIDSSGQKHFLGDGGFVNWIYQLLNGEKSSCLVSSLGTELLLKRFKTQ